MAKILVAEDETDIAQLVEFVLAMAGHEVTVVGSGALALRALDGGGFELLVTDDRMPEVSGGEVIARVRADQRLERLLIIAVSGNARRPPPGADGAPAADAYLCKPFDIEELVATIADLLGLDPE